MDEEDGVDFEFLITGLVYGLTFLVGMIGNTLIVYSVIHFRRMKSLSNVFLASLATADLLLIIFCVPVKFAQLFSHTWTFGVFLCKFVHYIQNLCAICSVYTLTAMSIERYYAIMYPVECRYICTMSQTKKVIILTWLGSIVMAMPIIFMQKHLQVGDATFKQNSLIAYYWCVRDWDNRFYWELYELYMLVIILIIPLIIMTYSYYCICKQLWSVMNKRPSTLFPLSSASIQASSTATNNPSNNQHQQQQQEQNTNNHPQPQYLQQSKSQAIYIDSSYKKMSQVIKMLIVVVIIFVLCWTPILVINVLTAFEVIEKLNYGYMKAIKTTFHLFSYANSCVNPIIYGFMSRNFRASFQAALTKCLGCKTRNNNDLTQIII